MGATVAAVIFIIVLVLFLLSVFGPEHSKKRFWVAIRRIRSAIDFGSYWFFNLCAIATILYVIFMVVRGLMKN